jgi:hypothetical protein
MIARRAGILVICCALLAACGGRSSISGQLTDGSSTWDRWNTRYDRGGVRDWGIAARDRSGGPEDRAFLPTPDSCLLGMTPEVVEGSYSGSWSGKWSCPGQPTSTVSGSLSLYLAAIGAGPSFAVKGAMTGTVYSGYPFTGSISGSMSCTTLTGSMPDIIVGSGSTLRKLQGALSGTFIHDQPTASIGFSAGQWKASDSGWNCSASGTWKAMR